MATKKTKKTKKTKQKKVKKEKFDIENLIVELQARFDSIDNKLDRILSQSAGLTRMVSTEHDPGFKTHATVTKKFSIPQDNKPRERRMYKAVCAECNQSCEVPFVPRAGRPVYCKTCYSGRRGGNASGNVINKEQIVAEMAKTFNIGIEKTSKVKTAKSKKAKAKPSKVKKTKSKAQSAKKTKTKKTKAKNRK